MVIFSNQTKDIKLYGHSIKSTKSQGKAMCFYKQGMLKMLMICRNIVVLCLVLIPYFVFADEVKVDNFRCGNKLIRYSMTINDVLKACPKSQHPKRQLENSFAYYYLSQGGNVEHRQYYRYKWFFESHGKFRRYVHFYHNQVVLITEDHDIRD